MANDEHSRMDPIESALSELRDAEATGVFHRTPVDPAWRRSAHDYFSPVWYRNVRYVAPVAAAIVLVFTVWTWMFTAHLAEVKERAGAYHAALEPAPQAAEAAPEALAADTPAADRLFQFCLHGPLHPAAGKDCAPHDYDGNGYIDLADFGTLQLAIARNTPETDSQRPAP